MITFSEFITEKCWDGYTEKGMKKKRQQNGAKLRAGF